MENKEKQEKGNRNPYKMDTPEWHLWAQMEANRQLVATYAADVARYTQKMDEARIKVDAYEAALAKLTGAA